jgi:F-type H+-transporting ATPase subunit delta
MYTARKARTDATRLWRLCLVNGRPDPARVSNIVDGLVDTTRTGARAMLAHFLRLVRLDVARWSARVDTAAPLEAADRAALEAMIGERYGRGIEAAFGVDPALIGGMRLRVGSDVYDGSIRARLTALDKRF